MKPWMCNCGVQFDTKKAMIFHYRKEHSDGGYECWDQIGDLGDKFANTAMEDCWKERNKAIENARELEGKIAKYEKMVARFNELVSGMNAVGFVIDNLRHGNRAER